MPQKRLVNLKGMSHAIKRLPNGGTLATLGDGTTVETTSEGVRIQTNKDGARVVTQLDGTITQSTPDGITITRRPDGSILQTNSDGACARGGRTLRVPLIPTPISARGAHAPPHLLTASPSSIPPRHTPAARCLAFILLLSHRIEPRNVRGWFPHAGQR